MSLHPTPTRRKLLRDVAAGVVSRYQDGHDYLDRAAKCTASVAAMERAGWVILPPGDEWKRAWLITEAGRAVLREAP